MKRPNLIRALAIGTLALGLNAAEPTADTALKTRMTERGKNLLTDNLTTVGSNWKAGKGKWEAADTGLRGSELKEDMHGAVIRQNVAFHNGVIQFSFRLDGTKQISLSLNGAKGHVSRVIVRPNGLVVQKDDQDGKNGPDTGKVLQTVETPIKAGEWHTLLVELNGKEILATLDGEQIAYGEHEAIDKPITNIGLTVAGESASFKNLTVNEGTQSKDWEKVRGTLKK